MGWTAADPQMSPYERVKDALRAAPQITASNLQLCTAFRRDPFSYLAAKLGEADAIAAEWEGCARIEAFHERERRQREAWTV